MKTRWVIPDSVAVWRQQGQAMLLVLLFLTVLMLSVLVMFNISQLTRDKLEVQNAADAVVYSAALLEARHLNFTAYTNRAMIANEVALAQTIGLATWLMKWGGTFISLGNVLQVALSPIPIVGPALAAAVKAAFTAIGNAIAKFSVIVGKFAGMFSKLVSGLNTFYGYSQLAFRFGTYETMLWMTDPVLNPNGNLVAKNAPGARIGTVAQFVQYLNMFLFEQYNKSCKPANALSKSATAEERDENRACMREMAAAVNDSRDGWSKDRSNYKLGAEEELTWNLWIFGKFGFNFKIGMFQEGGSTLRYIAGTGPAAKREHFNWSSMDTNEFKLGLGIWLFSKHIYGELPLPLGWGTMQLANTDKKDRKQYKVADLPTDGTALGTAGWDAAYGSSWDNNLLTSILASPGKAIYPWGPPNTTQIQGYGDLAPYHTIDPDFMNYAGQKWSFDWPGTVPPPYITWVYMPETQTRTSDNMGTASPAGRFALDNKAAGKSSDDAVTLGPLGQKPGLQAISCGQIYYKRTDGKDEEPNAFSPYWGARLCQVDNMVLFAAVFAQEPKLAWAFTGVQQSGSKLIGQVEDVKQTIEDEMTDVQGYAEDMIEDAVKGIFGI